MNKTLIALAVSAAAVATGVNAGELYNQDGTSLALGGRAEARLSLKDGKADDASRVRINVLGKTEINDGVYGLGFYEAEMKTYTEGKVDGGSDDFTTRLAYAGIGGNFGLVAYGKTEGSLGVITDFTDIFNGLAGNTAADKLAVADRTDNMISYKGQFDDLALRASYRFSDRVKDSDGNDAENANGELYDNNADGFSLSAIYAFGDTGFKAGAGYADQDKANEYMLAASYTVSDFYVAGLFTDGEKQDSARNKYDYTGYELAASYTMNQTVFTTAYNYAETESETSADNLAFEAAYFFKPNFRTWVSYNFNLIDDGDTIGTTGNTTGKTTASKADAEDEISVGLRYDF
ncbi:porin [Vibrio furnissii]|uniref:Outer membrane protein U n=1 Tax=Vibrio fluvialis TaxID=676 RepID=M1LXJ6_VIBFL|nr:porin [Vibrio furnissii]ADT86124.1 outer membrane protein OmpU [Vibrio furnissii NCTC 11218]AGF50214.1 outer membrane protein U [Vibrio fluvialis]WHR50152.1 porin [Vibrio furnissii]